MSLDLRFRDQDLDPNVIRKDRLSLKKTKKIIEEIRADPSIALWAEDEVMFYKQSTLIRKWALKGKQPKVVSAPCRDKTGYFGMVNLTTGRLITENSDQSDQYSFRDFLETVLSFTHEYKKVIVILDNAK